MSDADTLTPGQQARVAKLIELAEAEFGKDGLTELERKVLRCAAAGLYIDFCADAVGYIDLLDAAVVKESQQLSEKGVLAPLSMRPRPSVRINATLIRWLLTNGVAKPTLSSLGIHISGAYFDETIDLEGCSVHCTVVFHNCYLNRGIDIAFSHISTLYFLSTTLGHRDYGGPNNSRVSVRADGVVVSGTLQISRGTRLEGELRMPGATLEQSLEFLSSVINNTEGVAITADRICVRGSVFLSTTLIFLALFDF